MCTKFPFLSNKVIEFTTTSWNSSLDDSLSDTNFFSHDVLMGSISSCRIMPIWRISHLDQIKKESSLFFATSARSKLNNWILKVLRRRNTYTCRYIEMPYVYLHHNTSATICYTEIIHTIALVSVTGAIIFAEFTNCYMCNVVITLLLDVNFRQICEWILLTVLFT